MNKTWLMTVEYYQSLRPGTVRCYHCDQPFRCRNDMYFSTPDIQPHHQDCINSLYYIHKFSIKKNEAVHDPRLCAKTIGSCESSEHETTDN